MNFLCAFSVVFELYVWVFLWIIFVSCILCFCWIILVSYIFCFFVFVILFVFVYECSYELYLWVHFCVFIYLDYICELSYEFSLWVLFCVSFFWIIFASYFMNSILDFFFFFFFELSLLKICKSLCLILLNYPSEFSYGFSLWVIFCVCFLYYLCEFSYELFWWVIFCVRCFWVILWIIFVSSLLCLLVFLLNVSFCELYFVDFLFVFSNYLCAFSFMNSLCELSFVLVVLNYIY